MTRSLKAKLSKKFHEQLAEDNVPAEDLLQSQKGKTRRTQDSEEESESEAVDEKATIEHFMAFLAHTAGSPLKAWRVHFDDGSGRINEFQFVHTVRNMSYAGDASLVFRLLDGDGSGELSLDELHSELSKLWMEWCDWCARTFNNSGHMIETLHGSRSNVLRETDFKGGLERLGWPLGHEDILFGAMDVHDHSYISAADMKWLDMEKKKQKRKATAKDRAKRDRRRTIFAPKLVKQCFDKFKRHLKTTFGSYIRAWRRAVSINDAVSCSRSQFLTACTQLGFKDMSKVLWRSSGKDDNASVSIDFLDSESAEVLARFQVCVKRLGGVREAFRALDKKNVKRIKLPEFELALKTLAPELPAKLLFAGLDKDGSNRLEEDDLYFLDHWKLPEFLTASPSDKAKKAVKELLLEQHGNYLKAWRGTLDTDNSNRCSWSEFQQACRKIGFTGDVAGAWRALDEDLSGSISLEELDPESSQDVSSFREWADREFGGVKSAFTVFDEDGSNNLSLKEWRHACRIYGYMGNPKALFSALDVAGTGALTLDDIVFLDEWDFPRAKGPPEDDEDAEEAQRKKSIRMSRATVAEAARMTLVAAAKKPSKRAPPPARVGLVERSWWHELPCKQPFPKAHGPGTGLPVVWCSLCKSRGPCRHFARTEGPSVATAAVLNSTHDPPIAQFDHRDILLARLGRTRHDLQGYDSSDLDSPRARITGSLKDDLRLSVRSKAALPRLQQTGPFSAREPRSMDASLYSQDRVQLPSLAGGDRMARTFMSLQR